MKDKLTLKMIRKGMDLLMKNNNKKSCEGLNVSENWRSTVPRHTRRLCDEVFKK